MWRSPNCILLFYDVQGIQEGTQGKLIKISLVCYKFIQKKALQYKTENKNNKTVVGKTGGVGSTVV